MRDHLSRTASSEQTTLVLVRGESCTGKTRTAFEAVRTCLKDWRLVFPKNAKRLLALLDSDALAPRTVLWLNEAQNFLTGTDAEEAAAALHSRLEQAGPVVILCTLWPEYHRTLTATPDPGKDSRPNARGLLSQAKKVDVPLAFNAKTLQNLRVHRDRSLVMAASTSTGGRITQTLAAGPQLVDHYEQAIGPDGPYGHAVITAAMDARRLGCTSPLPAALLEAAAHDYLTGEQRAAADPDTWFAHALEFARQKVMRVAAALEPVVDPDGMGALPDVYRLSDYLDQYALITRRSAFPPDSFWTAVLDHLVSTADLSALAIAAHSRGRHRIAADLYRQAAEDADALVALAKLRETVGDLKGAEELHQRAAQAGSSSALVELARLRAMAGDEETAERLYQQAAEAGASRYVTVVGGARVLELSGDTASEEQSRLASEREWAGDHEGVEQLYQQAANGGSTHALQGLARLREQAGDIEGAQQLYQQAADTGAPSALAKLARLRAMTGDKEAAERIRRFGLEADGSPAQPW
ncbi:tetratricopeptide repeat protein [Streptomyces sp. NPDC056910]|uniref:tetratricopeptide repeat protein n=1 Tax=Streptomyces sp. NPDC056910 TaxID=3345964 RepID=UPI00367E2059